MAINFPASAHIAIASSPHVRQGRGTARDLRRKAALCACGLGSRRDYITDETLDDCVLDKAVRQG